MTSTAKKTRTARVARRAEPFATALAMAELVTGLEITDADVAAALESEFFAAPSLRYPGPDADGRR